METRRLALPTALALLTALAFPAAAMAATASPVTARPVTTASTHAPPSKAMPKCTKTSTGAEKCFQAQRGLVKDLTPAQRAERNRQMAQIAAGTNVHEMTAATTAAPAVTAPAQCNFTSIPLVLSGVANPDRFTSCSDVTWTITETVDTELVGEFIFEDQSWIQWSGPASAGPTGCR